MNNEDTKKKLKEAKKEILSAHPELEVKSLPLAGDLIISLTGSPIFSRSLVEDVFRITYKLGLSSFIQANKETQQPEIVVW